VLEVMRRLGIGFGGFVSDLRLDLQRVRLSLCYFRFNLFIFFSGTFSIKFSFSPGGCSAAFTPYCEHSGAWLFFLYFDYFLCCFMSFIDFP
jgi:hypothetical protein